MAGLGPDALVGVVGGGAMGAGIAQVAAAAGHPVVVLEVDDARAQRAVEAVEAGLRRCVEKGRLAEGAAGPVSATTYDADLAPAALLVEAIAEDLALKRDLFRRLEAVVDADCVLATNTSSLSIDAIAAGVADPGRVVGMHFFNPAPVMALVEVVSGLRTSPAASPAAAAVARPPAAAGQAAPRPAAAARARRPLRRPGGRCSTRRAGLLAGQRESQVGLRRIQRVGHGSVIGP